ncbi:MAG TPA: GspH/FimT family pseudopilin [Pseudomonas sp.]|jgi:type IV fimbrial biogenesis protein FimU
MSHRAKGFSLIELLITVSLVAVLAVIAIPSFSAAIKNSKADTEVSDLQRALNYARLEAINRGVSTQVSPVAAGSGWGADLKVVLSADTGTELRRIKAMSSGATVVTAPSVTVIVFNNLGGPASLSTPLVMTYTLGTITKTLSVCLNGRIVLSGSCT